MLKENVVLREVWQPTGKFRISHLILSDLIYVMCHVLYGIQITAHVFSRIRGSAIALYSAWE